MHAPDAYVLAILMSPCTEIPRELALTLPHRPLGTVKPLTLLGLLASVLNSVNPLTSFSDGCLGSNSDEGRSEMR